MPKPKVLRQWTEFDHHNFGIALEHSDAEVRAWLLKVMRKQDEIIGVINRIPEVLHKTAAKAVRKCQGRGID
jgi:hypothetical protein